MISSLLAAAGRDAPQRAFLVDSIGVLSYADADQQASRMSAALAARKMDRPAVFLPDSRELVVLLVAAARAGCEPCVLNRQGGRDELATLYEHLGFDALITDHAPGFGPETPIRLSELLAAVEPGTIEAAPDPTLVILTTGTTGLPKGARYRWASLVSQARIRDDIAGTRWLLAYHLNHFAGLQMLVHVIANRATIVLPASPEIDAAVTALVEHGVTHVSATPTFWRLVLGRLDRATAHKLPLRQITLGGEASSDELLKTLGDYFPEARISHVFATTEVGSCFSVVDRERGFPLVVLERGPDADVQLKIVDGELWVRSRHGMLGYVGEPADGEPGWRSTGDLVEITAGRVRFLGRASETINVGGVKINPQPLEELVQGIPGVVMARAYGQPNPVTGRIVALDVVAETGAATDQLEASIRAACRLLSRPAQPRSIRFVPSLENTNRKILRRST
ncbi:MAG: class I adenylate-forming enzyme family protein [Gammaproteobacteria bacterium]|nr:class I adenylate-forming enzyme family protein [Gammaproteobacteria bacterium]